MKKIIVHVLLVFTTRVVFGQIDWGTYSQSFPHSATNDPSTVALMMAIPTANNSFWTRDANSRHFFDLARDSSFQRLRPASLVARTTFDTARAQFFLHGVNPKNADAYQFRVTKYPTNQLKSGREIDFVVDKTIGLEVKETAAEGDLKQVQTLGQNLALTQHYVVGRHPLRVFDGYIWGGFLR